jgi:hypothetical protein
MVVQRSPEPPWRDNQRKRNIVAEYLPIIREAEYDGFKVIIPTLPRLYSEWKKRHEQAVQKQIRDVGVPPRLIMVSLSEFAAWCGGRDPIGIGLLSFTQEAGRRQSAGASSDS